METQPWGSQTQGSEHSSPCSPVATCEILAKIEEVESTLLVEDPKPTKEGNQDTLDATVVTSMEKVQDQKTKDNPTTDEEDPGCEAKNVSNEPQSSKDTSKDPQPTVKRLIVPPGHDVPIKQHMTDIFAKSRPTALPPQDGATPADGQASTTLDVKASIWMSQQELQKTKKKCQIEPTNNAVNAEPKDIPVKPSSWGTTPCISPDMQCPPKKRGRKPKGDKVDDENNNKDSKGTTAKAKMQRSKANKSRKSKTAAEASSSSAKTPSERMHEYLKEQKEKRLKAEEENHKEEDNNESEEEEKEMEATHGPDDADHGKEPSKGHKRKKGTKKSQVEHVDKGSKNKKSSKKAQQKKECSQKKAKKQPAKNPRKVAAAKEQVAALGKAEQKAERKKRYSRKSAAYHRAYKSTAGTAEEKKAAAKKAHCLQLYMFCHSVQCHASVFDPYISVYLPTCDLHRRVISKAYAETDWLFDLKDHVSWVPEMLGWNSFPHHSTHSLSKVGGVP